MKRTWILGSAILLTTGLAACGGRQDAATTDAGGDVTCEVVDDTRIGIATGNATGVYFALGNAYAEQLNATGGKLKATASETGASVQNIQQLVAGSFGLAFSLADTAADAVNGTSSFTEKQPIAAISRIHTNYTQVLVRKGAGITDVAGMRGKRVSTGSPKSGTEVIANRLLEAAGLDPEKDVRAERLDLSDTVDAMQDGKIDAMVWSGGIPTPGVAQLFASAPGAMTLLDIAPLLPAMRRVSSEYEQASIPGATYGTPGAASAPCTVL